LKGASIQLAPFLLAGNGRGCGTTGLQDYRTVELRLKRAIEVNHKEHNAAEPQPKTAYNNREIRDIVHPQKKSSRE
jgi:hypothetical protein